MIKNVDKFIEHDIEFLKTCFISPEKETEEDKKLQKKLKKQAEEIIEALNKKKSNH